MYAGVREHEALRQGRVHGDFSIYEFLLFGWLCCGGCDDGGR